MRSRAILRSGPLYAPARLRRLIWNIRPLGHSAEYRIDALLASRIEADDLMPYPNKFLLIENSFIQEPLNLEQLVFDLQQDRRAASSRATSAPDIN